MHRTFTSVPSLLPCDTKFLALYSQGQADLYLSQSCLSDLSKLDGINTTRVLTP